MQGELSESMLLVPWGFPTAVYMMNLRELELHTAECVGST